LIRFNTIFDHLEVAYFFGPPCILLFVSYWFRWRLLRVCGTLSWSYSVNFYCWMMFDLRAINHLGLLVTIGVSGAIEMSCRVIYFLTYVIGLTQLLEGFLFVGNLFRYHVHFLCRFPITVTQSFNLTATGEKRPCTPVVIRRRRHLTRIVPTAQQRLRRCSIQAGQGTGVQRFCSANLFAQTQRRR